MRNRWCGGRHASRWRAIEALHHELVDLALDPHEDWPRRELAARLSNALEDVTPNACGYAGITARQQTVAPIAPFWDTIPPPAMKRYDR